MVTGASRGLGRSVALALAARGAAVGLVARSARDLDEVAAEIEGAGGRAVTAVADLGITAAAEAAVQAIHQALGAIDILINNAATIDPVGPFATVDPQAWARSIDLNLVVPMRLTRGLLEGMRARGYGRIVNVSSGGITVPELNVGINAYLAAKGALEMHTLNLAAELEGSGVTANILRSGLVDTAMQEAIRAREPAAVGAALHAQYVAWHRDGALQPPQVAAALCADLVSSDKNGTIADAWPS